MSRLFFIFFTHGYLAWAYLHTTIKPNDIPSMVGS